MPTTKITLHQVEEICVIDDDYVPRFLAQKIFGYEMPNIPVLDFDGSHPALEYIHNDPHKKRLILVDLNMPIYDGWHFVENYNPTHTNNLIFILSSSDNPKDREKLREYPHVTDFIEKPISIERLNEIKSRY
jgi:response regulator RpfG family c-di-GMP phosphodiesterase